MSSGRKVLVADDSAMVVAMLTSILQNEGYEVVSASDGLEALNRAHEEAPDLILLDITMPKLNGYQVCRLLKNDPVMSGIPIVILTGSGDVTDRFWSLQTGADEFLTKDFEPEQLLGAMQRVLAAAHRLPEKRPLAATLPDVMDVLGQLSGLLDQELYRATVERIQLETVLDGINAGVFTTDRTGVITSANRALGDMLGLTREQLVGQRCDSLAEVQFSLERFPVHNALVSDGAGSSPVEYEVARANDSRLPVSETCAPLSDHLGKVVGGIYFLRDITRQKEVERMHGQLQEAYEQLNSLTKLKDDLTHMIIHDLRTPLTSLITGLQTVELLGEMNPDQQEFVTMAIEGGQTLLGMVNDLLDITKMEEGSLQLERQEVSVAEVVAIAVRQVQRLAIDKGLTLATEMTPEVSTVYADEDKLRRALVNLMGNSIKFTAEGGVTVSVKHIQTESGDESYVAFSVQDTGEGIPGSAFKTIFEKFGQVETRKGGRKMSTGLGLTFCKLAVEAHGGCIWVESELGVGSTFSFTIPCQSQS